MLGGSSVSRWSRSGWQPCVHILVFGVCSCTESRHLDGYFVPFLDTRHNLGGFTCLGMIILFLWDTALSFPLTMHSCSTICMSKRYKKIKTETKINMLWCMYRTTKKLAYTFCGIWWIWFKHISIMCWNASCEAHLLFVCTLAYVILFLSRYVWCLNMGCLNSWIFWSK